jgi:hypothetical protein
MTVRRLVTAATCMLAVVVLARHADAYPQFQLSRDQTCSSCHISPAGGGLLNENGTNTAESISQFGTDGNFMYNAIPLPSWLEFGGDLRNSDGYLQTPEKYLVDIPMQADVYGTAAWGNFRIYLTGAAVSALGAHWFLDGRVAAGVPVVFAGALGAMTSTIFLVAEADTVSAAEAQQLVDNSRRFSLGLGGRF